MTLNRVSDSAIIIAGSGICTGGHVLHRFKHNLWRDKTHAGQDQLVEWANTFEQPRPRLFLIHGEPDSMHALQKRFVEEQQWNAYIPSIGEVIRL